MENHLQSHFQADHYLPVLVQAADVVYEFQKMLNAIGEVFPNTKHRWCLWHIMKKVPEKLQSYINYKTIKSELKRLVCDSITVADFELEWQAFIEQYDLNTNDWLTTLFEERHRWIPCYLKSQFWAGMSTTQRSEGLNAFFDGFINSETSLQQFVVQYDNALRRKAEKEFEADFASSNTTVACGSQSLIERQFQLEYTHAKFADVKNEFRRKINCFVKSVSQEGCMSKYTIKEEWLWEEKKCHKMHNVVLDTLTTNIQCSCMLFEFRASCVVTAC